MNSIKNKIYKAFENKKAFIAFLTAGDPDPDSTVSFILELVRGGADLIEIGIPFSDPTAEGVVIQDANIRALSGGMTCDKGFEIVGKVREQSDIPLAFMTYLNPVFYYGYERFFSKCRECGVDGIIIPDLPFEEREEVAAVSNKYDVTLISMISPTSADRIRTIASMAEGFIYVVSSMGVTGVRSEITTNISAVVENIREATDTPCAVGFGISTPSQAAEISGIADGCIVGSAIVKIIARYGKDAGPYLYEYVSSMKMAMEAGNGSVTETAGTLKIMVDKPDAHMYNKSVCEMKQT